jgi:hypothetical protein
LPFHHFIIVRNRHTQEQDGSTKSDTKMDEKKDDDDDDDKDSDAVRSNSSSDNNKKRVLRIGHTASMFTAIKVVWGFRDWRFTHCTWWNLLGVRGYHLLLNKNWPQ